MADMSREEAIEHLKNMKMPHDKFYEETNEINKALIDKGNEALGMAIESLENQKTGHWILRDEWFDDEEKPRLAYGCDRCGFSLKNSHEKRGFCPNCGAKMEGENK